MNEVRNKCFLIKLEPYPTYCALLKKYEQYFFHHFHVFILLHDFLMLSVPWYWIYYNLTSPFATIGPLDCFQLFDLYINAIINIYLNVLHAPELFSINY